MLAGEYLEQNSKKTFITTHDSSMTCMHVYQVSEGHLVPPLWTHGEFLRFATVKSRYITKWQADFTFAHPPGVVESLPTPGELIEREAFATYLLFPMVSRLAINLTNTRLVWDARDSKRLLQRESDEEIHIWKESPDGYILHRKLAVDGFIRPNDRFSPQMENQSSLSTVQKFT